MANDCLVTKLKGVVQNDNLSKLGEIRIKVTAQSANFSIDLQPAAEKTITVSIIGNGVCGYSEQELIDNPHTTLTFGGWKSVFFSSGTYQISISSKYDLQNFVAGNVSGLSLDLSAFTYCKELTSLLVPNHTPGNLSSIKSCTKLTNIGLTSNTQVRGNLRDLGYAPIRIFSLMGTLIEGTLEELVATALANGISWAEEENFSWINFAGTTLTWYGHTFPSGSWGRISWFDDNGVTKIALYCNTNEYQDPDLATTIWCSGYGTQEQAEAAFPGKTVVRVDA